MKKKNKIVVWSIMSILVLSLVGVGVLMLLRSRPSEEIATGNKADITWYDEKGTEFVISTVDELYDFMTLSEFYDFTGQTIKLGADIVINEGSASDWAEKAPERVWYPISGFAGTFDGQGHTISGMYAKGIDGSLGMFTDTSLKSVIRDFRLVNSYFKSSDNGGTGSIVGHGGGMLDTIYSDAIVHGTRTNVGGLVGIANGGTLKISNCWFAGEVKVTTDHGYYAGGILGVAEAKTTMEHCLNTAEVSCNRPSGGAYIGGLCGNFRNKQSYDIKDCMNLGTVVGHKAKTYMGAIFGRLDGGAQVHFTDTYTTVQSCTGGVGSVKTSSIMGGFCGVLQEKNLIGTEGYRWTTLDFENYWTIVEDGAPILKAFAEKEMALSGGLTKAFSVDWFNIGKKESTIQTKEDLYGFYVLSSANTFEGKVIKLGADIVLNDGKASEWNKNAPENTWTPITKFAGTFDGQGHTISGIYVKNGVKKSGFIAETTAKAVIQNLQIKNSYYENTIGATALMGSVAGVGRGIFDTIYSDAILVCNGAGCGGIAGQVISSDVSKFTNCWFNGSVTLIGEKGRYGGGILGLAKADSTMEHCLNTGSISTDIPKGGAYIGGLCGYMSNGFTYHISDSMNAGMVERPPTKTYYGSIFGRVDKGSTVNASNVYAVKEACSVVPGGVKADSTLNGAVIKVAEDSIKGVAGYQWTTLDFSNYWTHVEEDVPVLASFAKKTSVPAEKKRMVDISWYDKSKTTYTIDSVEDLYGFYLVSATETFAGKTVKLGADLVLNEGKASDWAEVAPANQWIPITKFAGTFDGQGHTISGIYVKTDVKKAGFFAETTQDTDVKKLSIRNSYYESIVGTKGETNAILGSVAGLGKGTFSTIYSDAILVSDGAVCGGIAGQVISTDTSKFSNCWFAGSITLTGDNGRYGGGILGIAKADSTIWHCLNTGTITTNVPSGAAYIGGMCGYMTNGFTYTIRDCMNRGDIIPTGTKTYYGAIFGRVDNETTLHAINTYAVSQNCSVIPGSVKADSTLAGTVIKISENAIKGFDGYKWTTLDFENYWTAVADDTPVLKSFAEELALPADVERMVTVSWYDESKDENTIDSAKDLYGFYLISANTDFEGKTILLGKDITVNNGNPFGADEIKDTEDDWSKQAPTKQWTPIAEFAGTFDGNGKTINGLYVKTGSTYAGLFGQTTSDAKVKNIQLKNSYFESTSTKNAMIGSIAGRGNGSFEKIYSDAVVKSTGGYNGGIIGQMNAEGSIAECWFDGTITLTGDTGRYGGGIVGEIRSVVTMKHCLNTGTITTDNDINEPCIGGLCGQVHLAAASLSLEDNLNVGEVKATGEMKTYVGSLIGLVNTNADATIVNTYATEESCGADVGYYENAEFVNGKAVVVPENTIKGYDGYIWTTLNFANYWAVDTTGTPVLKHFASNVPSLEDKVRRVDIEWCKEADPTVTTYYIDSEEDLYGLYLLSANRDFAGKKIQMKADIIVNNGTPAGTDGKKDTDDDWSKVAPDKVWTPIRTFAGTFDGEDPDTKEIHKISGLYTKSKSRQLGLFKETTDDAKIQNLRLVDSYFENTATAVNTTSASSNGIVGSIAGLGHGEFKKIYSNATLVSGGNICGGIVGEAYETDQVVKFTDCWFAGSVSLKAKAVYGGAILGRAKAGVEITHCYNSGTIAGEAGNSGIYQGGFCGRIFGAYESKIADSLNASTVSATTTTYMGAILGRLGNTSTLDIDNVYAVKISNNKTINVQSGGTLKGDEVQVITSVDNLKGDLALTNASGLSFTGNDIHWVQGKNNGLPELKCFESKPETSTTSLLGGILSLLGI